MLWWRERPVLFRESRDSAPQRRDAINGLNCMTGCGEPTRHLRSHDAIRKDEASRLLTGSPMNDHAASRGLFHHAWTRPQGTAASAVSQDMTPDV